MTYKYEYVWKKMIAFCLIAVVVFSLGFDPELVHAWSVSWKFDNSGTYTAWNRKVVQNNTDNHVAFYLNISDGTTTNSYTVNVKWNVKPSNNGGTAAGSGGCVESSYLNSSRAMTASISGGTQGGKITASLGATAMNTQVGNTFAQRNSTQYDAYVIPVKFSVPTGYHDTNVAEFTKRMYNNDQTHVPMTQLANTATHSHDAWPVYPNNVTNGTTIYVYQGLEAASLTTTEGNPAGRFWGGGGTLKVNFAPNTYTVNYHGNGATAGSTASSSHTYNTAKNLTANGFTRRGYTFAGWNTKANGSGDSYDDKERVSNLTSVNNGTVTLYAQWEPIDFTLNFDPNGASGSIDPVQNVAYDSSYPMPEPDFEKPGYAFLGWNTKKYGTGRWISPQNVQEVHTYTAGEGFNPARLIDKDLEKSIAEEEITFFAQWSDQVRTITFRPNGGRGEMDPQTIEIGEETALNANRFKQSGYIFAGWSLKADGSDPVYANKSNADDIAWPNNTNAVNLYAVWKKGKFSAQGNADANDDIVKRTPDEDGKIRIETQLASGQSINLFGLDKRAQFYVIEGADKIYDPSFDTTKGAEYMNAPFRSGERGQQLSTDTETLYGDTEIQYTNRKNTQAEGYDLSFSKKLKGDGITDTDKSKEFPFRYIVTGLDPDYTYNLEVGENVTPLSPTIDSSVSDRDRSGYLNGTVNLKGGDVAVIRGIPEGAKYSITEITRQTSTSIFDYTASYEVTAGSVQSQQGNSQTILPDGSRGMGLSTNSDGVERIFGYGAETMPDQDVSYEFVNSRGGRHSLTLRKFVEVDGEYQVEVSDERFTFKVYFSGLQRNTAYRSSVGAYSFTTDNEGKARLDVQIKNSGVITWYDLDCECIYDIVEEESEGYEVYATIIEGDEIICQRAGGFENGIEIGNFMEREDASGDTVDFNENQDVAVTNNKITKRSLKIGKTVKNVSDRHNDTFHFTTHFTDLEANKPYTYIVVNETQGMEDGVQTFTSDASGTANVTFGLKNGYECLFPDLYRGAKYTVREAASSNYTPSYTFLSGVVDDSEDDSEGTTTEGQKGEALSTEEKVLNLDTNIMFTNTREYDTPAKKVSDTDGMTINGVGAETLVEENFVKDLKQSWTYTITQKIAPGFSAFSLNDVMPANVNLDPESIAVRFACNNGTTYSDTKTLVQPDDEPDYYETSQFRIDADDYHISMTAKNEEIIRQGGDLTVTFKAGIDPKAELKDFLAAGQVTADLEYAKLKNAVDVQLDDISLISNQTTTTVPMSDPEHGLKVRKVVTGEQGNKKKNFAFTANFSGLEPDTKYYYGTPDYLDLEQVYSEGKITATVTYKGMPMEDVSIKVYSASTDELLKARTTSEEGEATFAIDPGIYRYEVKSREDILDTYVTIAENEPVVPLTIMKRSAMRSFTTDDAGEVETTFTLKDGEEMLFSELPEGSMHKITEAASDHLASYVVSREGTQVSGSNKTRDKALSTEEMELTDIEEIVFTNRRQYEDPVKKVSDTDGKTLTGNGQETLVKENFIADPETPWEYKVTQKIDPGFDSFRLEDTLPSNTIFQPETLRAEYVCNNGTKYDSELEKVEEDGMMTYQNDQFWIEEDDSHLTLTIKDKALISEGGDLKIEYSLHLDPEAEKEDFVSAGQMTPDFAFVKCANAVTTNMGNLRLVSNQTVTTLKFETTTDLIVHKNVTGNLGDRTKNFRFSAVFKNLMPETEYFYGVPEYLDIQQTYSNGEVTATVTHNDAPVKNVTFKVYSVDDGTLKWTKVTGENGKTNFALAPGIYRYQVSYENDSIETNVPVSVNNPIEPLAIVRKSRMASFLSSADGAANVAFSLKDDEGITFCDLPVGGKYKITEAASDHTASYAFQAGTVGVEGTAGVTHATGGNNGPKLALSTAEETLSEETKPLIVFTNHRELSPPTGSFRGIGLLVVMALLLAGILALVMIRRIFNLLFSEFPYTL